MLKKKCTKIMVIFLAISQLFIGCNNQQTINSQTPFQLEYKDNEDISYYEKFNLPILLNIGAPSYCPTCKQIQPQINDIYKEMMGKVIVKEIDLDYNPEFKNIFSINKVPTQIFIIKKNIDVQNIHFRELRKIEGGNEDFYYFLHEGYLSKEEIKTVLEELGAIKIK